MMAFKNPLSKDSLIILLCGGTLLLSMYSMFQQYALNRPRNYAALNGISESITATMAPNPLLATHLEGRLTGELIRGFERNGQIYPAPSFEFKSSDNKTYTIVDINRTFKPAVFEHNAHMLMLEGAIVQFDGQVLAHGVVDLESKITRMQQAKPGGYY
jgi:hypothetical protein